MAQDDYYQLLGVRRGASQAEIKRAFRSRVLEVHPDHHHDSGLANEATRRLVEAYKILTDPGRRKFYDLPTAPHMPGPAAVADLAPSGFALAVLRFLRAAFAIVILIAAALCLAQAISTDSSGERYTFSNLESIHVDENELVACQPASSQILSVSSAHEAEAGPMLAWTAAPSLVIGAYQPFSLRLDD